MSCEIRLDGISSKEGLRRHIIDNGCYSSSENERIFEKWFLPARPVAFREADKRYKITDKTLCDIGCGYGATLAFCNCESYGLEISEYQGEFANSIGLNVLRRDVLDDDLSDLPKVDVVWTRDVLEHVDAPHVLLRKAHGLLKPGGLLLVSVPVIPPFPFLKRLPYVGPYFGGYTHSDHVNAFTPATLAFFCERAGFETKEISPFYPGIFSVFNKIVRVFSVAVYVGTKVDDWEYGVNSTRATARNPRGYVYKGMAFPKKGR